MASDGDKDFTFIRIEECMDLLGSSLLKLVRRKPGASAETWDALLIYTFFLNLRDDVEERDIQEIHQGLRDLEDIQENESQIRNPLMDLCFKAGAIFKKYRGFKDE